MEDNTLKKTDSNETAIVNLLTINHYRIYAFIISLVANQSDADDIMQEVSTVIWNKRESYKSGTDFVSWALTIAKFQVLKYRKMKKLHIPLDQEIIETLAVESVNRTSDATSKVEALKECVKKLPSDHITFVQLKYQDGLSVKVISERTGMSIYQVYRRFAAIHGNLLRCIRRSLGMGEISL